MQMHMHMQICMYALPYGRPGRRGAKIAGGAGSPAPPEILGPADLWGEIAQDSRGGGLRRVGGVGGGGASEWLTAESRRVSQVLEGLGGLVDV